LAQALIEYRQQGLQGFVARSAMVQQNKYTLLQTNGTADIDPEDVSSGFASYDEEAASSRVGVTKYAKALSVLLLLGMAVGIYSVANSPAGVVGAQPSGNEYEEAHNNLFYEVGEDVDSTPPPQSGTVVGQLGLSVSSPDAFANDPGAYQAVKETIGEIAGVPPSAVTDVELVSVNGIVQANFKITPPAGRTAAEVAAQVSNSSPESDSAILSEKIADAGLSATYPDAKVTAVQAAVEGATTPAPVTTTPVNPCATTPAPTPAPVTTVPVNPCTTTPAPTPAPVTTVPVNPCITTSAPTPAPTPVSPCDTTPAPTIFGRIFR